MRHKILVAFAVFLCMLFLTVIGVPAKTRLRPGALLKGNIGVVFPTTDEINNIGTQRLRGNVIGQKRIFLS